MSIDFERSVHQGTISIPSSLKDAAVELSADINLVRLLLRAGASDANVRSVSAQAQRVSHLQE